jgi:hypothetical protein
VEVESRKRKRSVEEEGEKEKAKEVKIDYGSTSRPFAGGPHYHTLAVVSPSSHQMEAVLA